MEVTFRRTNYTLEFSDKQLYELFYYFNQCYSSINGEKRFYEGGAIGFLKSGKIEIVPDIWTPGCTRKAESYTISDKMMKLIEEKKEEQFAIHHFHSHLSDLPFPSVDDPYNVFDLIGVVSLSNFFYNEFRIFQQFDGCSYPPYLGNIKSGKNISTLVRFDKNKRKISFFPIEEKVTIKVSDMPFLRDW
jgi:hypothetical protein